MSMVNKAGLYFFKCLAWTMGTSSTGLPEFQLRLGVVSIFDEKAKDWLFPETEGMEITGYFYPVTKENKPNETQIAMLKEALGWDGASFESLHGLKLAGTKLQGQVKPDSYNGRPTLKLAWIYSENYQGPMGPVFERAKDDAVKGLDAKWGAALKGAAAPAAKAGGTAGPMKPGAGPVTEK